MRVWSRSAVSSSSSGPRRLRRRVERERPISTRALRRTGTDTVGGRQDADLGGDGCADQPMVDPTGRAVGGFVIRTEHDQLAGAQRALQLGLDRQQTAESLHHRPERGDVGTADEPHRAIDRRPDRRARRRSARARTDGR